MIHITKKLDSEQNSLTIKMLLYCNMPGCEQDSLTEALTIRVGMRFASTVWQSQHFASAYLGHASKRAQKKITGMAVSKTQWEWKSGGGALAW